MEPAVFCWSLEDSIAHFWTGVQLESGILLTKNVTPSFSAIFFFRSPVDSGRLQQISVDHVGQCTVLLLGHRYVFSFFSFHFPLLTNYFRFFTTMYNTHEQRLQQWVNNKEEMDGDEGFVAHKTLLTSLGPYVCIFLFPFHFPSLTTLNFLLLFRYDTSKRWSWVATMSWQQKNGQWWETWIHGPRDVNDISWAIGMFFFLSFHCPLLTTDLFIYYM